MWSARVSKDNVARDDFNFYKKEVIERGVSPTVFAHEALNALRRYKQGELVEHTEIRESDNVTKYEQEMLTRTEKIEEKESEAEQRKKKSAREINEIENAIYQQVAFGAYK